MFKTEKMFFKNTIDDEEIRQGLRKKLLTLMEENPGMGEYIRYLQNRNGILHIILGVLISIIGIELMLLGKLVL